MHPMNNRYLGRSLESTTVRVYRVGSRTTLRHSKNLFLSFHPIYYLRPFFLSPHTVLTQTRGYCSEQSFLDSAHYGARLGFVLQEGFKTLHPSSRNEFCHAMQHLPVGRPTGNSMYPMRKTVHTSKTNDERHRISAVDAAVE